MSRQLLLDLGTPPPETFDNFVAGPNAELVARLHGLRRTLLASPDDLPSPDDDGRMARAPAERVFYIWGDPGSGRSHLLRALCQAAPEQRARLLVPQSPLSNFAFDPQVALYAIDDCDRLPPARQIATFNLFNEVRADPKVVFVATGAAPPMGLTIRDDLRTRLGWGLVYRLAPLSDDEKSAALSIAARERGLALAADVPPYLLNHFERDMPSLKRQLDALERFSLERKRAITLPLLRAMLAARDHAAPALPAATASFSPTADASAADAAAPAPVPPTARPTSPGATRRRHARSGRERPGRIK
ncbi:DnaA regulatory inactivator Hda [Robbsia sp. Bb-Pol-6]|uniref:DnaA regulatory inactivator Hda n=1 Tax=Robbsia betulipollinis TaxID=2981849 RepID=A0ABT3ZSA6_9BURK|nr:DnaA regulatory inactivator Hda [Robbsia betulipollinis]